MNIKEVSALTNNLALTLQLFTKAMKAGLDWLTISFDGLEGKIHTGEWFISRGKLRTGIQDYEYKKKCQD